MDDNGSYIYGFLQDKSGQPLYDAVQKAADDCRAAGADYVILMGHLGNETECSPWMYSEVIENTNGIDAMLDGHSHDTDKVVMKNKDGKDVLRAACGTKLNEIGLLYIPREGEIDSELYHWGAGRSLPVLLGIENKAAEAVYEGAAELNKKLAEVVATSTVDLFFYDPETVKDGEKPVRIIRRAETNLGDLCADAFLDQAGDADLALLSGGGIRVPIARGEITLGDILKVYPFGNSLTVIEVSGQQVLDALEWSVHAMPEESGGFFQAAGVSFKIDSTIPSPCVADENAFFDHIDETMERRVRDVLIAGKPLDPEASYKLASTDYLLLNSGDGYTMFKGAKVLQNAVKLDNQVLIDYITGTLGGHIGAGYENPYGQGRITAVKSAS